MSPKAWRKFEELVGSLQKRIKQREKLALLFYGNGYMKKEVAKFRKKYGIPDSGFSNADRKSKKAFYKWRQDIRHKYPEPWAKQPQWIIDYEKDWEQLTPEEQGVWVEPYELWQPDCHIDVKPFQEELRKIFERYSELGYDNYPAFERYVLTNEEESSLLDLGGKGLFIPNMPRAPEEVLDEERDAKGKIVKQTVRARTLFKNVAVGQPDLVVEKQGGKVKRLSIDIKPDTILSDIHHVWREVESYQKIMPGYRERMRHSPKLKAYIAVYRMTQIGHKSVGEAMQKWNDANPDEALLYDTTVVRRAIAKLKKIYKPRDI